MYRYLSAAARGTRHAALTKSTRLGFTDSDITTGPGIRPHTGERNSAVHRHVLSAAIVTAMMSALPAGAVSIQIGDVDSFGFNASDPSLQNVAGDQIDLNGDGVLGVDEALPSLDGNSSVATGSGDDFDNRSAAEKADDAAKWTDVSLSTSFDAGPGDLDDVAFTLTFSAPQSGDADYVDHFLNIISGDVGDPGGSVTVDGTTQTITSFAGEGLLDGGVTLTSVIIPLADMLDGQLDFSFSGSDPYVAFDAMLLDPSQRAPETPAIPVPASLPLLAAGICGLALLRRRRG